MREFLPLLTQERWYTRTRRGYARGWEPVRYVENVQAYLNILEVAGTTSPQVAMPAELQRRATKNSRSSAPHSSASTPEVNSMR